MIGGDIRVQNQDWRIYDRLIGGDIRVQNQDWRIYDRRRYQGAESGLEDL